MDRLTFEDFEISPFGRPPTAGVYAIWARNFPFEPGETHLLYIGSTDNINKRLQNHKHPYLKSFNRLSGSVFVSFFETENYKEIEKQFIKKYQPRLNKQWR